MTRAVFCAGWTADTLRTYRGRGELLVHKAFDALREHGGVVPRRVVGDLLQQDAQDLADTAVTLEAGRRGALPNEDRDDVIARDGEIAHAERRALREHGPNPRLEALVAVVALAGAGAGDVGPAQGEQPVEVLHADPADEAPQGLVLRFGVRRIHVVPHEVCDALDRLVRQPQP